MRTSFLSTAAPQSRTEFARFFHSSEQSKHFIRNSSTVLTTSTNKNRGIELGACITCQRLINDRIRCCTTAHQFCMSDCVSIILCSLSIILCDISIIFCWVSIILSCVSKFFEVCHKYRPVF